MTGDRLSRRRVLAIAAATVTAGCGAQNNSDSDAGGRFEEDSGNASATATATATSTEEGSSIEINREGTPTETETESTAREPETTEQPEETPERTETEMPTGAERLERAEQALNESITVYTDVGGADSILDVDASATAFDEAAVRERLSAATTELDAAADVPAVDQGDVDELRAVGAAIEELVACQVAVIDAYREFDRAETALFDEEFDTVSDALSKLELNTSKAASQLSSFERNVETEDLAAVDGITEREYQVKVDQFSGEVDAFEEVGSPIDEFNQGLEGFNDGVDSYVGKDYGSARQRLLDSQNGFEIPANDLSGIARPRSLNGRIEGLIGAAEALAAGTDHLIDSSKAGNEDKEQERQSDFNDAIQEYQRSGAVTNLESYDQLLSES
ncbi:hypothetical protein [Halorientalis salina]|uniref:hypothetical protein n=1 Tax=Halorientalis salina TaxID=2932266 RepID=UPI0010AD444B|nr:hypothetical protein [Halorientalis salina]